MSAPLFIGRPFARRVLCGMRGRLATWRRPAVVFLGPTGDRVGGASGDAAQLVPVHDEALVAWRAWCQEHVGQRCRLALSGRWLLTCVVPDMAVGGKGRRSAEQARLHAAGQWAHYLGLDGDVLALDWVMRLVRIEGGTLVCAMRKEVLADFKAVAAQQGVTVVWMGPWWAEGMARWLRASAGQTAPRVLTVSESGWWVHFEAEGSRLQRLWIEPEGAEERIADAPAAGLLMGLTHSAAVAQVVAGSDPLWEGIS